MVISCNIFLTAYMSLGVGIRFQKTLFSSTTFYICNINQLVPINWFSVTTNLYTRYCIVVKQLSTKYCCLCRDGYDYCLVFQCFGHLFVLAILYLSLQMVQFLVNHWRDKHGLETQRVLEGSFTALDATYILHFHISYILVLIISTPRMRQPHYGIYL